MNKNGFTLVELLAVLVLISIIALITTVSVRSVLSDSKESLSKTQEKNIEEAAKTYYLKEGSLYSSECVNLSKLIEKGYIDNKEVKDPKNNERMTGSVEILYNSNQYSYKYQSHSCEVCTIDRQLENKYSVGDIVSCELENSTEKFYVIENQDSDETPNFIDMLAEKNINATGEGNIIQMNNAGGVEFSSTKYWMYSTTTFNESKYGDALYANIYDENNDIIKPIFDKYLNYLNTKLIDVEGKLIAYKELENLGCYYTKNNYDVIMCEKAPSWVYSGEFYWTGAIYKNAPNLVFSIEGKSNGAGFITYKRGIRPVITISESNIK